MDEHQVSQISDTSWISLKANWNVRQVNLKLSLFQSFLLIFHLYFLEELVR